MGDEAGDGVGDEGGPTTTFNVRGGGGQRPAVAFRKHVHASSCRTEACAKM